MCLKDSYFTAITLKHKPLNTMIAPHSFPSDHKCGQIQNGKFHFLNFLSNCKVNLMHYNCVLANLKKFSLGELKREAG